MPAAAAGVSMYNIEGYAAASVTGGGYIAESDAKYRRVTTPAGFIAALRAAITRPGPTKSAFYQTFRNRGVELGPSHRGVEEIFLDGKGEGLATIRLPGSSARGLVMDAGALDSIIQSGLALVDDPEADVVPFAVVNTLVVGALTDTMIVHIRQRPEGMDYVAAV
ncbi:polyketide synthase dehydratase domain-containing protein [Lysobacter sp. 2RAB21]